jgi:hypothetical protein
MQNVGLGFFFFKDMKVEGGLFGVSGEKPVERGRRQEIVMVG